ncbi:hypothetical protein LTR32_003806 [Rachicladosporium monterosium]|uniref:Up-regulated during septation protein 1 domain-containing protein n=1 Tax=Rachicladosporium monterosium TaxID=1507873 RepID=A0ABR0L7R0_9PEZI|nr:hypothetical protein LTR32_003806 [Rachicladosporium monterosium]
MASSARPAAKEDAKKESDGVERPRAPKIATATAPAPTSSRTSALTARTSGTTINKPPTRPNVPSARKPAAKASEHGASSKSADGVENKRPAGVSMGGTATPRGARPDSAADKVRRTTVGGSTTAPIPPKRPAVEARTRTASPTKLRPSTAAALKLTSTQAAKPPTSPTRLASKSSGGAGGPVLTDSIPEEVEQNSATDKLATLVEISEDTHLSPRKLEIRSMKSATPVLKPQALSDNEQEGVAAAGGRPRPLRGHSRTQSAIIPTRPMTAPAPTATAQEQSLREMEIIQNLLRESTKRETMAYEIRDLKAELAKMGRQNKKLLEAAKSAPKPETLADAAKERALKVMLTSQHMTAIDELKDVHKTAMAAREQMHAQQLQHLRSELDTHRKQTSHLESVDAKIEAVEDALRESKRRASQNEQEYQQSVEEKDKLARVIDELRKEIMRCQAKLNDDVAQQVKKEKEAQNMLVQLRKELEDERRRSKEKASKEREAETEREESRRVLEQEVDRLKQAAKDAEAASEMMRRELSSVRKEDEATFGKNRVSMEKSAKTIASLRKDLQRKSGSEKQQQRAEESQATTTELRLELDALRLAREKEQQDHERTSQKSEEVVSALQEQIRKLQQDGNDGGEIVETLQTQLRELQQLKHDMEGQYKTEAAELRRVVESLQLESEKMRQMHDHSSGEKNEETRQLNTVIENLQSDTASLQQQLDDAVHTKDESARQLNEMIEALSHEAKALKERAEEQSAATEKENGELTGVIAELHSQVETHRLAAEEASSRADENSGGQRALVERLQNEIQAAQHRVHDERAAKDASAARLAELEEAHDGVVKELKELRAELEATQDKGQEESAKVEELEASLADAEAAQSSAEASLRELRGEMEGLQRVLETFANDAQEKGGEHAGALERLRRDLEAEHEVAAASTKEDHAKELASVREDAAREREDVVSELEARHAEEIASARRDAGSDQEDGMSSAGARHAEELASAQRDAAREREEEVRNIEARHAEELVSARQDAARELEEGLSSLEAGHAGELASARQDAAKEREAVTLLQQKFHALEAEKNDLAEKLAEGALQGQSVLDEEAVKRSAPFLAIQNEQKEFEDDHTRRLAQLTSQHDTAVKDLQSAMTRLKLEHGDAMHSLTAEHERNIARVEEAASRRAEAHGAGRDRVHEAALAAAEAEHGKALLRATRSPVPAVVERDADIAGTETSSRGLSHVFVNRQSEEEDDASSPVLSGAATPRSAGEATPGCGKNGLAVHGTGDLANDGTPMLAETPLAYTSEDEHFPFSPSPAYPRDGRRAGARPDPAKKMKERDVEERAERGTIELQGALTAAQEELSALKRMFPIVAPQSCPSPPRPSQPVNNDNEYSDTDTNDPFAPRTNADPTTSPSRHNGTTTSPAHHSPAAQTTLEGTLASLRVQTEQLLEINDDFIAEQKRWSRKLGLRGQQSVRRSSLRAAS